MLAVLAAAAEGRTEVSGAKELRVKESDRIKCVAENLKKVGADIVEKEDGWIINGGRKFKGSVVTSFGDHRIAMSMIIAGLVSEGEMIVEDTEWIDTSFPGFMDIVRKVSHR
jgi:3-phosphoshikimate 1-carboxyvinyltransferase